MNQRLVAWGIDTLHLFTRFPVALGWADQLQRAKEAAKEHEAPVRVVVGGLELTVRGHGTAAGAFLLESDLYAVKVAPKPRSDTAPTVSVEIRALALWSVGWRRAARTACGVMAELTGREQVAGDGAPLRPSTDRELDVQVTRLDLCVDFQGWTPTPDDLDLFTTRVRKSGRGSHFGDEWLEAHAGEESARVLALAKRLERARSNSERAEILRELHHQDTGARASTYGDRRVFTGFSFGRGMISARLYDKTRELSVSRKGWFREVWRRSGTFAEEAPVWRLEFQLRREALVDFHEVAALGDLSRSGMGAWEECREALPGLWSYLTARWMRHGQRTKDDRQAVSDAWAGLQRWPERTVEALPELHRVHLREAAASALPQLGGYLASAAAQLVELEPDGTRASTAARPFGELVVQALAAAHAYAEAKERPIETKFQERRAAIAARRRELSGPRRAQAAAFMARALDVGTERPGLVDALLKGFGRQRDRLDEGGAAQRYVERLGVLVRHDLQDDAGEEMHRRRMAELDNEIAALRRDLWAAVEVDDAEAAEALRLRLSELEHHAHGARAA